MSNLKKFADNYDWSGLEFPVTINKISIFEKKNNISVMVLALKGPEVYIVRKSERKCSKNVQLLLITDGKHRHYTAIKSLSRLLGSRNSKHAHKQYFCLNCLQSFHSELSRDKHYEYCKGKDKDAQTGFIHGVSRWAEPIQGSIHDVRRLRSDPQSSTWAQP